VWRLHSQENLPCSGIARTLLRLASSLSRESRHERKTLRWYGNYELSRSEPLARQHVINTRGAQFLGLRNCLAARRETPTDYSLGRA
jgi:hypothetical protein